MKNPWENEPNELDFVTAVGLPAYIQRVEKLGHLCGYVLIPRGHPWFEKEYDAIHADVHGGLTYSRQETATEEWWIGFDCGHAGDFTPSYSRSGSYRTVRYVKKECERLALQVVCHRHCLMDADEKAVKTIIKAYKKFNKCKNKTDAQVMCRILKEGVVHEPVD
ncbi:MAG: hypothetical protein Q8K86_10740 [Candidatus Nanopelagicaceae bacterium]|nr:hypothetical protein [Candidatus Nanopelagicaceae bacterium]